MSDARTTSAEVERARLGFRWDRLPVITHDLPGTGGLIRATPEEFLVTEIPAYLPSGIGSHLYLLVEKRGLTTSDLMQALKRGGVEEKAIGAAGLKDKAAVTVQWLSIPKRHREAVAELTALPGVRVLEESYHSNKLGIGHLRGNRFAVTVQGVVPDAAARAEAVLAALAERGSPNWYGPQRFGRFGGNAYDGLRVLRGESVPGGHRLKRFFVAALQSHLFNGMLAERVKRGWYQRVVAGDWARKHDTGGTFLVEDEAAESPRAQRLEISATLPLFGRKVKPSGGAAGEVEQQVLTEHELSWAQFGSRRGDRRPSRVLLEETTVELVDSAPDQAAAGSDTVTSSSAIRLAFTLPKGSYATAVLRELTKQDVDAPFERADDGDD